MRIIAPIIPPTILPVPLLVLLVDPLPGPESDVTPADKKAHIITLMLQAMIIVKKYYVMGLLPKVHIRKFTVLVISNLCRQFLQ